MQRLRYLLAATDLSQSAKHAAERAALLAGTLDARLDLLHVINRNLFDKLQHLIAGEKASHPIDLLAQAKKEMYDLAKTLMSNFHVSSTVRTECGPVLQTICQQIDTLAPDLLVLGARGAGIIHQLVPGSTAKRMLRKTTIPALVVKCQPKTPYRRVLVPLDFSPASIPSIRLAHAIAPDAEIFLLHAYSLPFEGKLRLAGADERSIVHYRDVTRQEANQKLNELCRKMVFSTTFVTPLVLHGDAWMKILEIERERSCDLIVIGKHGESMLEDLFLGSVTESVLAESQCDVLVSV